MSIIHQISELLQKGRAKNVKELVQQALDQEMDPKEILNEGLLSGMSYLSKTAFFATSAAVAASGV